MKANLSKGCLIHLPSKTVLFDKPSPTAASDWIDFETPKVFLVIERCGEMCKVSHQGRQWYVSEKLVYSLGDKL